MPVTVLQTTRIINKCINYWVSSIGYRVSGIGYWVFSIRMKKIPDIRYSKLFSLL